MRFVQYFVAALMLSAQKVLGYPTGIQATSDGDGCHLCPAGMFQKSCTECKPCSDGSYTDMNLNREESCHLCFRDCSPSYNLRVVQNCTRMANLKCDCEPGFRCVEKDFSSENCKKCEKIQYTTVAAVISGRSTQSSDSVSLGFTNTCQPPKCGPQSVPTDPGNKTKLDNTNTQLAAILCPVLFVGCVALVILFCIRRPQDEPCFRQTIAKLCNDEVQDTSHKSKESTHQFHRDSFSTKQQPSSLSAANQGSVHVHNPGTVIFSLLSQFTGQVGPTILGSKTAERASSDGEDERDCPVFHPTSSPCIHLSEEERSGEIDNIFFPSQEQGKDCHVSKEESL